MPYINFTMIFGKNFWLEAFHAGKKAANSSKKSLTTACLLYTSNDLTLYGLSNAVTRHSQDVPDYDRATALEGIGYNILSMPAGQWSRINQMAA